MEAFETTLFTVAISLSFGLTGGALGSVIGRRLRDKRAEKQGAQQHPGQSSQQLAAFVAKAMRFMAKSVFLVLGIALVWALCFMVLGLVNPARTEWAANVSTLMVGVITVFSIMVAFYEFLYRGKGN